MAELEDSQIINDAVWVEGYREFSNEKVWLAEIAQNGDSLELWVCENRDRSRATLIYKIKWDAVSMIALT
jgi:hypothetical protein